MRRTCLAGLLALLALTLSSIGASPAFASECFKVDNPTIESGNFETKATCEAGTPLDDGGNYFKGTEDRRAGFLPCVKVQLDLDFIVGYKSLGECTEESTIEGTEWLMTGLFIILPPIWFENNEIELEQLGHGESRLFTATASEVKLTTKSVAIGCKTEKASGELIGGLPGTGKATIKFEGCEVALLKCKVGNKGGTLGIIEVPANLELVNTTKAGAEEGAPPYGVLLKTTAKEGKVVAELTFEGTCSSKNGSITATGEEHGPGISGVAMATGKIAESAETESATHEVNFVEKEQTSFIYLKEEVKSPFEGKAGLRFGEESLELVAKMSFSLESKHKWLVGS